MILGAGVGRMAEELAYLNAPYHERGAQTHEYLRAMKGLWMEAEPQFRGRSLHFSHLRSKPKLAQTIHPPL